MGLAEEKLKGQKMSVKNCIVIGVIVTGLGFAAGRYLAPEKVRIETQTVEVKKYVRQKANVTTVTIEKPDGSKETTIVDRSVSDEKVATVENQTVSEDTTRRRTNVAAMMTVVGGERAYGGSVSREVVGPVTVGVFGLSNPATAGVSVGVNF